MVHWIAVLILPLLFLASVVEAGGRDAELKSELAFLETLESAGRELCTDPELDEVYGACRVWIDPWRGYNYFLMFRRGGPWKVWRVPLEGIERPEVRWRASDGCHDDVVCA